MNISGRVFSIISILLISTFFVFNCKDSGTDVKNGSEGSLVVKITDGPFPIALVEEANVTIDKIEVRKADDSEGNPFIVVAEDITVINLVDLRNGITKDLAEIEIPVGSYDLVRLYVAEASIKLTSGLKFDLTIPSGAQTGIKIFIKPAIVVEGGLTTELLLDFDLSQSFEVQGDPNTPAGINGFHFSPVVRAVNNSFAGRLIGSVTDNSSTVLEDAEVWVEQDSKISATFSDADGLYALIGLPAGSYTAFATKVGFDTVSVENVEITAGNKTTLNFSLTPQ